VTASLPTEFGETWVYESIVGALPGVDVSDPVAVGIQIAVFETAVLGLAVVHDAPRAAVLGTAAVLLAAVGSVEMLRISRLVRSHPTPVQYERLLFGSKLEVVLAVLVYVALVTHLFVFDPRHGPSSLLESLFGPEIPVLAAYVLLLIGWDVSYRVGANWWASVVGLWRAVRYRLARRTAGRYDLGPETVEALRRADVETAAFGLLQLSVVPFLGGRPVLRAVLLAHSLAVVVVSGSAALLMTSRE
jgi:hypothetical protein